MRSKLLRGLLIVFGLVAALIIVLHVIARPAQERAFFENAPPRPLVIAHQGGDGMRPGESMEAYRHAVDLGADVLEGDVHSTSDGALILMHDDSVDRTTDGGGLITAMTLAKIKALDGAYDWSPDEGLTFPYRGQGLRVITVEELFAAFPDMLMNLEIKQVDPSIAHPFCDLIRKHEMQDKVLVASFKKKAMDDFRAACPEVATSAVEEEVRTYFVLNTVLLGGTYWPSAEALQVPEYSGGLHVLTPGFVSTAHSRGMEVHAWTINEEADMRRLLALGLDGIITDYPDRLLKVLGR